MEAGPGKAASMIGVQYLSARRQLLRQPARVRVAEEVRPTDHDVIEEDQPHELRGLGYPSGERVIVVAGLHPSAGVVVGDDDARDSGREGGAQEQARVHLHGTDAPAGQLDDGEHLVAGVQVDHVEGLLRAVGQLVS